jgi:hypothetical protein
VPVAGAAPARWTMTKFKVGDVVEIMNMGSIYYMEKGIVNQIVETVGGNNRWCILTTSNSDNVWVLENNIRPL